MAYHAIQLDQLSRACQLPPHYKFGRWCEGSTTQQCLHSAQQQLQARETMGTSARQWPSIGGWQPKGKPPEQMLRPHPGSIRAAAA